MESIPSIRTKHVDTIIQTLTRVAKDLVVIVVQEVGNSVVTKKYLLLEIALTPKINPFRYGLSDQRLGTGGGLKGPP